MSIFAVVLDHGSCMGLASLQLLERANALDISTKVWVRRHQSERALSCLCAGLRIDRMIVHRGQYAIPPCYLSTKNTLWVLL